MEKLKIIVGGYIGLYPTGGVTWDYIQYPLGLKLLGHDVYYIEDTVQYSRFQAAGKSWEDASDSIAYLKNTMEQFGFKDRWAYRDIATGDCFGLSLSKVKEICKTADVFINISASTYLREEYRVIPKRIFIDSDPMFTQIEYLDQCRQPDADNPYRMKFMLDNHNYLFTFGEHMNREGCEIPDLDFKWHTTRQPVCLEQWKTGNVPATNLFTTVMNWSVRPNMFYDNKEWGQKNVEFKKYESIPGLFKEGNFEIMMTGNQPDALKKIAMQGWKVSDPLTAITNADKYRSFIDHSSAEFSVAKETYIKANTGWFSCRSACYLAAGKPVVTQETQWSKYIPAGTGLFAFSNQAEAVESLHSVISAYDKHSKAAREIAETYFDSNTILSTMLEQIA